MKNIRYIKVNPKVNTWKQRLTVSLYSIMGWEYSYTVTIKNLEKALKENYELKTSIK